MYVPTTAPFYGILLNPQSLSTHVVHRFSFLGRPLLCVQSLVQIALQSLKGHRLLVHYDVFKDNLHLKTCIGPSSLYAFNAFPW